MLHPLTELRRWAAHLSFVLLAVLLAGCQSAGQVTSSQVAHHYQLTYAAIGASDAFGVGTDEPAEESWPTVLSQTLSPTTHLVNLGIPGATVAQATQIELPIAVDTHPDVITIWLAVNDLVARVPVDTYSQQLRGLIDALHSRTTARIFVGNLPDLTVLPSFADRDPAVLRAQVTAWNSAIAATCQDAGVHLVDIFSVWNQLATHPEYISADGLHPSALGAKRLADLFAQAINGGV